MVQNAAARLVFNKTKRVDVAPLLIELHRPPVADCNEFKSLMLTYRVLAVPDLSYLNYLVRAQATTHCCILRMCCLAKPSYRHDNPD